MEPKIVTIADSASGARAKVLPDIGFNCYGFSVPTSNGALETLWAAPDFTDGTARPSGSGIPLLFPFAGRLRGTSFQFQGKDYPLEAGDGQGNAIHGFVINRKWRVTDRADDRVVGQFQASVDDESLLKHWPADFRITAEYRVAGTSLLCDYTIENPDDKPLPFAFGTHAYFRVPLGGTDAARCQIRVPATTNWELKDLLPTGKADGDALTEKLAKGLELGDEQLDNVFGGLQFDNHRATTSVYDPQSKRRLVQTFDDQFVSCVVYTPPHRQAVCMEPYSTVPDPFALLEMGIDPSLKILEPGKSFRTRIEIRLEQPA